MKLGISSYPSADSLGFSTVRIFCHRLDIRVSQGMHRGIDAQALDDPVVTLVHCLAGETLTSSHRIYHHAISPRNGEDDYHPPMFIVFFVNSMNTLPHIPHPIPRQAFHLMKAHHIP